MKKTITTLSTHFNTNYLKLPVVLLLLLASIHQGLYGQTYTIGGISYSPCGTSETVTAQFNNSAGALSSTVFSKYVLITCSGTGNSNGGSLNDAFYYNITGSPIHDANYYQLVTTTGPSVSLNVAHDAYKHIVYNVDGGFAVTPPYTPAYKANHIYSFIINMNTIGGTNKLRVGVNDGQFGDNSGFYTVKMTQLCCTNDADGDGVCNEVDNCITTSNPNQANADGDALGDVCDGCPNDPNKTSPGQCGCGTPDTDNDGDGTANCNDGCPNDANKTNPGQCGCGKADTDSDGDSVADCNDACPNDPNKIAAGTCGCGVADTDSDGDGTADCNDACPNDPNKTAAGICGCDVADTDSDGDGTADCNDACPNDENKTAPGQCGCGIADTDNDGDGTANCNDACPDDPNKIAAGICGCGVADTDSDGDGTANCNDGCPNDANKIAPGQCGCGIADTDNDGDGVANCNDGCPNDANKIAPGQCGCGIADTDNDGDGIANCNDNCDNNSNSGQADSDCDGVGDACDVCPGGDDTVDNNNDGKPDCKYPPAYSSIIAAWKCGSGNNQKVFICHNNNTLCVSYSSLAAHIAHGDYLGSCSNASCDQNLKGPSGHTSNGHFEEALDLEVTPNPAYEEVEFTIHGLENEPAELQIFDNTGKLIWENNLLQNQNQLSLNLKNSIFYDGIYMIRVNSGGSSVSKRLIIIK